MNKINSIQVLGPGCPSCKKLLESTKQAVEEVGLGVTVEYITDIQKMLDMGVMSSPVLAINGQAVLAGQQPSVSEIKKILSSNDNQLEEASKPTGGRSCGGNC